MTRIARLALAGAALAAAGCASSDLSRNAEITQQVAEGLPVGTPAPSLVARAVWFPKSHGSSPDASPIGGGSGVLALAGDKLWFLSWNDSLKAYDVSQSIDVPSAVKFEVERVGMAVMLVVESKNYSFDSFELMKAGEVVPDAAGAQALCQRLRAIKAANPPPDLGPDLPPQ